MPAKNPRERRPVYTRTLSEDAMRRCVQGLELLADRWRKVPGQAARDEVVAIRRLQNQLDKTGRWCEALDEVDDSLDDVGAA